MTHNWSFSTPHAGLVANQQAAAKAAATGILVSEYVDAMQTLVSHAKVGSRAKACIKHFVKQKDAYFKAHHLQDISLLYFLQETTTPAESGSVLATRDPIAYGIDTCNSEKDAFPKTTNFALVATPEKRIEFLVRCLLRDTKDHATAFPWQWLFTQWVAVINESDDPFTQRLM